MDRNASHIFYWRRRNWFCCSSRFHCKSTRLLEFFIYIQILLSDRYFFKVHLPLYVKELHKHHSLQVIIHWEIRGKFWKCSIRRAPRTSVIISNTMCREHEYFLICIICRLQHIYWYILKLFSFVIPFTFIQIYSIKIWNHFDQWLFTHSILKMRLSL